VGFAADISRDVPFVTTSSMPLGTWRTSGVMGLFDLQNNFNTKTGVFTVPQDGEGKG
jgi:hypothetical protein